MSALSRFMTRGFISPQAHGVLDYPLAGALIIGPLAIDFDYAAATVIALVFAGIAVVQALATNWSTGIVRVIPPLVHGYVGVIMLFALIILPFCLGFSYRTGALLFYVIVGAGGLAATLATRFGSPRTMPARRAMMFPEAA